MAISLVLLEIKNAPGESTVKGYEDHIAVDSFTWDVRTTLEEKTTDDPVTKVDSRSVKINKQFDRSSTILRKMMDKDLPFTATLRFLDPISRSEGPDGKIDTALEIQLLGCHIDSIDLEIADDAKQVKVSESIELSFTTSATISYRSYDKVKKARGRAMTAEIPTSEVKAGKT